MGETEKLSWKVAGDFVTNISRQWFYDEHKSYSTCIELIMSCLINPDVSNAEKEAIAISILEGKKRLTGLDAFTVEDDSYVPKFSLSRDDMSEKIFELMDTVKVLERKIEDLEDELRDMTKDFMDSVQVASELAEKLNSSTEMTLQQIDPIYKIKVELGRHNFIDKITWDDIFYEVDDEIKRRFNEFCYAYKIRPCEKRYGDWEWVEFHDVSDKDEMRVMSTEELIERGAAIKPKETVRRETKVIPVEDEEKPKKKKQHYGWLAPDGKFTKGDWGTHEVVADKIIRRKKWEDEFYKWENGGIRMSGDFLCREKGYVLLHNPSMFGRTKITSHKPYTTAQRDFLFEYLMNEGDTLAANALYEE